MPRARGPNLSPASVPRPDLALHPHAARTYRPRHPLRTSFRIREDGVFIFRLWPSVTIMNAGLAYHERAWSKAELERVHLELLRGNPERDPSHVKRSELVVPVVQIRSVPAKEIRVGDVLSLDPRLDRRAVVRDVGFSGACEDSVAAISLRYLAWPDIVDETVTVLRHHLLLLVENGRSREMLLFARCKGEEFGSLLPAARRWRTIARDQGLAGPILLESEMKIPRSNARPLRAVKKLTFVPKKETVDALRRKFVEALRDVMRLSDPETWWRVMRDRSPPARKRRTRKELRHRPHEENVERAKAREVERQRSENWRRICSVEDPEATAALVEASTASIAPAAPAAPIVHPASPSPNTTPIVRDPYAGIVRSMRPNGF